MRRGELYQLSIIYFISRLYKSVVYPNKIHIKTTINYNVIHYINYFKKSKNLLFDSF